VPDGAVAAAPVHHTRELRPDPEATDEGVAERFGIPVEQVLRFDLNTSPAPPDLVAWMHLGRLESGIDLYTSADFPTPPDAMDLPIDRMSGLLSVAGGARTSVTSWLRAYVQLGVGVELTRVAVPYGADKVMRDTKVMPEGFIGVGSELRLGRTYFGMSLRTLLMGNFNYQPSELDEQAWGVGTPDEREVFDASVDFAAQGQFYVRRDL